MHCFARRQQKSMHAIPCPQSGQEWVLRQHSGWAMVVGIASGKIQGDSRKFLDRFKSCLGSQIEISQSLNEVHIYRLQPTSARKGEFFVYNFEIGRSGPHLKIEMIFVTQNNIKRAKNFGPSPWILLLHLFNLGKVDGQILNRQLMTKQTRSHTH